jgi:hypothetical protein
MAGVNAYTKLLLHCDGADTSTTLTDSSTSEHAFNNYGTAQIDTAQSKFGGASALFDGDSDYWECTETSADFAFGSSPFTIDLWVRFPSLAASTFLGHDSAADETRGWRFWYNANYLRFRDKNDAGSTLSFTCPWTPSVDTWYHVCVMRDAVAFYLFIGGSPQEITYDIGGASTAMSTPNNNLRIGKTSDVLPNYMVGWMDEIRIQKGEAYFNPAGFTPPSAAYSVGTSFDSLLFAGD